MVDEKDIDIQYIQSEKNPDKIMNKTTLDEDFARNMRRITEVELWELVDTRRRNFKKTEVTDDVITHDKNE